MFSPVEIAAIAGVAMMLFGADKVPKLARSLGQAKKEFLVGQEEANASHAAVPPPVTPTSTETTTGEHHPTGS